MKKYILSAFALFFTNVFFAIEVKQFGGEVKFGENNLPTTESIKKMLESVQYFSADNLQVEMLTIKGDNTDVMYQVIDSDGIHFLQKSQKKTKEEGFNNLNKIDKLLKSKNYRSSIRFDKSNPDEFLPKIILPVFILEYKDAVGSSRLLEVLPKAKGSDLAYYLYEEYADKENEEYADKENLLGFIGLLVGLSLGNFQKKFMQNSQGSFDKWTTLGHNDFHINNVFFSINKNDEMIEVSFIDNDTMKEDSFAYKDVEKFLEIIQEESYFSQFLKQFIMGYVYAFIKNKKESFEIIKYFYPKYKLNKFITAEDLLKDFPDKRTEIERMTGHTFNQQDNGQQNNNLRLALELAMNLR